MLGSIVWCLVALSSGGCWLMTFRMSRSTIGYSVTLSWGDNCLGSSIVVLALVTALGDFS